MKKIFILGSYGKRNFGDEALLQVLVEKLREEYKLIANSADPSKTSQKFQIDCLETNFLKKPKKIFQTLLTASAYLFGGGTIITENEETDKQRTWFNRAALWQILFILIIAKILRKKTVMLAIGVGHLETKLAQFLAKLCLNLADLVIVRDEISLEKARSLARKRKIYLTADLTMALDLNAERTVKFPTSITIGICPTYFLRNRLDQSPRMAEVLAEASDLLISELKAKIILIPLEPGFLKENDLWFCRKIYEKINQKERASIYQGELTPKEFSLLLNKLTLLISLRLHGLIMAFLKKVPVLGIERGPKIKGFMKMIDQEIFSFAPETITSGKIVKATKKAITARDKIRSDLARQIPVLKKKAQENFKLVNDFLI